MPDSTSAMINMLANPPNPFVTAGQAIQGMNALQDYKANAAAAEAYRQSIDENGNFDQAKFNSIASQLPGGSWKFGNQMQQAGQGLQAQGLGTSADMSAKLDQQATIGLYMQDVTRAAVNGEPVTGQMVTDAINSMPSGLIPPARLQEINKQLEKIGPDGNARNFVLGAAYANRHAISVMQTMMPGLTTTDVGSGILTTQPNPRASGGMTTPYGVTPRGLTPGEAVTQHNIMQGIVDGGWTDPKTGDHKEGTLQQWREDHPSSAYPIGTVRPGPDGTFTIPGVPGEAPLKVTPATPPATRAPRPGPGSPMPAEPSGYLRTPGAPEPAPAAGAAPRGGAVVPSPRVVAAGEDAYNAMQADIAASANRQFTIRSAIAAVDNAKTGPGTETFNRIQGVLGTWAPEWATKFAGIDPRRAAANHAEAAKYMQQIANAGQVGGAPTNDKLAASIAGSPNVHMSDLGAKDVLKVMDAAESLKQYVFRKAQKENIAPARYAQYGADWAESRDPRAFMIQHLDNTKRAALAKEINSGSPAGKKLRATIDELVGEGVIPDPTKPLPR